MSNFDKFVAIIKDYTELDENQITLETNLRSDLGIDSYELINLVCAVEKEFGVSISDRDIADLSTIQDFLGYVEAHK